MSNTSSEKELSEASKLKLLLLKIVMGLFGNLTSKMPSLRMGKISSDNSYLDFKTNCGGIVYFAKLSADRCWSKLQTIPVVIEVGTLKTYDTTNSKQCMTKLFELRETIEKEFIDSFKVNCTETKISIVSNGSIIDLRNKEKHESFSKLILSILYRLYRLSIDIISKYETPKKETSKNFTYDKNADSIISSGISLVNNLLVVDKGSENKIDNKEIV